MKLGRISFDLVHAEIPILNKFVLEVQQVHRIVPEVSFAQSIPVSCLITGKYLLEFAAIPSSSPANPLPSDPIQTTTLVVPTNPTSSSSAASSLNICMMCTNTSTTPHENLHITMQADFADIKALASRLIAGIHADEVEKKLLR